MDPFWRLASSARASPLESQMPLLLRRLPEPSPFFFAHHSFFASDSRCRVLALILARPRFLRFGGAAAALGRAGRVTPSSAAIAWLRRSRSAFSSARIVSSDKGGSSVGFVVICPRITLGLGAAGKYIRHSRNPSDRLDVCCPGQIQLLTRLHACDRGARRD